MFDNFVSLGYSCPTASCMSKYGLRSWSGPFDWLVTADLEWVLSFMEYDFAGFLERDNLERLEESPKKFRDKKSGFIFLHDGEFPFEEKYDELMQKYQKRIDRYLKETEKKTCFLRSVSNQDELDYISENYSYINRVIKSRNNHNEIIFLIRKELEIPNNISCSYYIMSGQYNLQNWFDHAEEFLIFCAKNYDAVSIMRNGLFEQKKVEIQYSILQMRYNLLVRLSKFDFTSILFPGEIIIYGAGNIGQIFYQHVKDICKVECFVDEKKAGDWIAGIPVKYLEEIDYMQGGAKIV